MNLDRQQPIPKVERRRRRCIHGWYLPIFFEWQRERVAERGGDMKAFQVPANRVVAVVQRVLGVP